MEAEKDQYVSFVKERTTFNLTKSQDIVKRLKSPALNEMRRRDIKEIIRSIKEPDLIIKGTKVEKKVEEEEPRTVTSPRKTTHRRATTGSPLKADVGFIECMTMPRPPDMDETESDTTIEKLTTSEEEGSSSFSEPQQEKEMHKSEIICGSYDTAQRDDAKIKKVRKVKCQIKLGTDKTLNQKQFKRWKPNPKRNPKDLDPLIKELPECLMAYLKSTGVVKFLIDWFQNIFSPSKRPKDPVKLLRKHLDKTLNNAVDNSGLAQMQTELKVLKKREDIMRVEISKLKQLTHLLAPEIYDEYGNMIQPEPSIEEEEGTMEEEMTHEDFTGGTGPSPDKLTELKVAKSKGLKKGKASKKSEDEQALSDTKSMKSVKRTGKRKKTLTKMSKVK